MDLWCPFYGHDSQLCTYGIKVWIKAKGLLILSLIFVDVSPLLLLARQNPDPVGYDFVILVSCLEYVDVCQLEFVLLLFGELNVRYDCRS